MKAETPAFDITAEIPTGTTVLQASAGTGKTWTISALVTRLIAEQGAEITDLLIVTFTNPATRELRSRIRQDLTSLAGHLNRLRVGEDSLADADPLTFFHATGANKEDDPEAPLLEPAGLMLKIDRLRHAAADVDAADINTIHSFCSGALEGLGAGYDTAGYELVTSAEELIAEVIDDVYLKTYMDEVDPEFPHRTATKLAELFVQNPTLALHPPLTADLDPDLATRVGFISGVREEFARRKRDLGIMTYNDQLTWLADVVDPPGGLTESAASARAMLRERWPYVLVDEFQDTDDTQWRIFRSVFHGHGDLILIGDPKQAIYGFRGGDIHTYLAATKEAQRVQTLGHNYRADKELLRCLNGFLTGAELGAEEIRVEPVGAGKPADSVRFAGEDQPRLRLRVVGSEGVARTPGGAPSADGIRAAIAADLTADISRLLTSGHEVRGSGGGDQWRAVEASDIAVLCHGNTDATSFHRSLTEAGIHAVVSRGGNVFATEGALEWLTLLEAIDHPRDARRIKTAALTPFFGYCTSDLLARGDDVVEEVSTGLRTFADLLATGGPPAIYQAAQDMGAQGMAVRVLGQIGGERHLTDLRHIADLMHANRPGATATVLAAWLRSQREEASRDEDRRRLGSDDSAVQIYTIHSAKGLEFPFVYLPTTATESHRGRPPYKAHYQGRRTSSLDDEGVGRTLRELAGQEQRGERLRALYVALTRGVGQVTAYWGPSRNIAGASLHRLLTRSGGSFNQRTPVEEVLAELRGLWGEHLSIEQVTPRPPAAVPGQPHPGTVEVRQWTRTVDTSWRRSSYTSLAAGGGSSSAADFKETPAELSTLPADGPPPPNGEGHLVSPMDGLPKGARFGSLVHQVLEHLDFSTATEHDAVGAVEEQLGDWPQDIDAAALGRAIQAVITTPLLPALPLSLAEVDPAQRLNELEFEIPLDGGQWPAGGRPVTVGGIAPLLRAHLAPEDPLRRYAETIDSSGLADQALRGYLTGSIDLIFRSGERFYVADYKTNWLGPAHETNTTSTYDKTHLERAMEGSSYPLQALLYTVALHRYLRWRLPGYDPGRDIGGVLYLYVRGMAGRSTPVIDGHSTGVFYWRPPAGLITGISELFDGEAGQQ